MSSKHTWTDGDGVGGTDVSESFITRSVCLETNGAWGIYVVTWARVLGNIV